MNNLFQFSDLHDSLDYTRDLHARVVSQFKPKVSVLLFSGGKDSTALLHVVQMLDIHVDAVLFIDTGTGLDQTLLFVNSVFKKLSVPCYIVSAGDRYLDRLSKKGFYGLGAQAHSFSYHELKHSPLRAFISAKWRRHRHNFPIVLYTGARKTESVRRKRTMASPIKVDCGNIFVNLLNVYPTKLVYDLAENSFCGLSPVYNWNCKSGECNCGTMANRAEDLAVFKSEARGFYDRIRSWERFVFSRGFSAGWAEVQDIDNLKSQGVISIQDQALCTSCQLKLPI